MQMKTSVTVPNVMMDPTIVRWLQFLRDDVANLNTVVIQQEALIKDLKDQIMGNK